ncbi:hypothetical protein L9F63_014530 [Diploptera punctata]|uniref:Centrosome-associated zinc finger protein CP190 n=1 Tax=Diploptera punctata TaxID=6984 RepID=A0AAD8A9Z9_DIPPU|nr:hypothetical protein L9F63_014530 [Diploptera punctata]
MSEGTIKQVKVDNWGIFFLQRLQQLFIRSERCDLVLQFATKERIKVHRLVLNVCTEYFQLLEKQGFVNGEILNMPSDLQSDVVIPIINFMYTGKLEFRTELHNRLYTTAQKMNMTVLTKLLDAQNAAVAPHVKPMIKRQSQIPSITYNLQGKKIAPKQIDPDLPETLPGRKLPIWKRRSVPSSVYYDDSPPYGIYESTSKLSSPLLDESPRPTRFEWPEEHTETSPYSTTFDDLSYETKPIVKPIIHTANKNSTVKSEASQRVATFEEVCRTATNSKRIHSSPVSQDEGTMKKAKLDLQAVKEYVQEHRLRKVLLDTAEENGEEVDDDLAVADFDDDDDMDDEDGEVPYQDVSEQTSMEQTLQQNQGQQELQQQSQQQQQFVTVHQQQMQHVQEILPTVPHQEQHTPEQKLFSQPISTVLPESISHLSVQTPIIRQSVLPPQKSILKAQVSHEETVTSTSVSVGSKKVRFLLDAKSPEDDGQRPLPTRAENFSSIGGAVSNTGNLSNHAKIITEVLKKYPHLVKNNKNIRLKIMQRGGSQAAPMVKSKVSYVVLKSDVAGKGKPAVVLKHGGHVEPLSELVGQKPASGAENTTGPWLCHSCGSNEEPIHFETYYLYRRHLQDVHMEKIDARICEHCGHRASKRNLLLYHLYTKHGVPPPRNCQFPKCDQCDYVALSESLLIKHRNNHSNNKEFVCKVCNAAFKSNGALQGHMQTNLHSDPTKKLYECPFCQKPFVRNINLKAHIRTSHKEVIRKIDEEGGSRKEFIIQSFEDGEEAHSSDAIGEENMNAEGEEEGELMEVPVIDAVMQKPGTGSVFLPSGVTVLAEAPAVQSLVPSSEAEALSNVASGIAASLGLADTLTGEQTVIVLDDNHEFLLHSTEVVGEETTSTEGKNDECIVGTELQEYIVPDIMPDESQEQQNNSYTGPLTDLEQYSGEGHSTIKVTPSQTATAPPPVSVAVSVVGGDEVTMVLTDHDYAPIRDSNGEGVMFFITRPAENTDSNDAASQQELPVLIKEVPQQSDMSQPVQDEPPVLTREIGSDAELEQRLGDKILPEPNEAPDAHLASVETSQHEVHMEEQTELPHSETENSEEVREVKFIPQVGNVVKESESSTSSNLQEDPTQEEELRENEGDIETVREIAGSTEKKVFTQSIPIRRQPPVQMADIMKEWDDFDDENDGDEHSSELPQTREEVKQVHEDEPRVLRGPVCEEL